MGVAVELLLNCPDHLRMAVSGVHHPNPAPEIDQPVTVRVGYDRALGMNHRDRGNRGHSSRHRESPPVQELAAGRPRDLGLQLNHRSHGTSDLRQLANNDRFRSLSPPGFRRKRI